MLANRMVTAGHLLFRWRSYLLLSFVPANPFADLARAKPTSIISVVIFAAFLGVAALQLLKDDVEKGQKVLNAIDTLQAWVMRLVRLVMKLTPYGVLALMTKVVAGSNLQDIIKLGSFVVVSYLGLGLMFVVHGLLVALAGMVPETWIASGLAVSSAVVIDLLVRLPPGRYFWSAGSA